MHCYFLLTTDTSHIIEMKFNRLSLINLGLQTGQFIDFQSGSLVFEARFVTGEEGYISILRIHRIISQR